MESTRLLYKSSDKVTFKINNKTYTVDGSVPPDTTLNSFIRNVANLTGTKNMCLEGGCGSCIVSATMKHIVTGVPITIAVNSCLILVFSCHGWDIFTIEGIGNRIDGYNKIQKTLAKFNGTQCGYCSPGMVMNMFSLSKEKNGNITMKEVENSFGGNICRCTGYRPILDAFKSLCVDAPPELVNKVVDIEDFSNGKKCPNSGLACNNKCDIECNENSSYLSNAIYVMMNGSYWCRVTTTKDVFEVFSKAVDSTYMLVGGNTGNGVYRRKVEPKVFIDITGIKELKQIIEDPALNIGACVTLTELMNYFNNISSQSQYWYTKILAEHIDLIASVPVRNIGTIAGNLSLKYEHNEFPSDLFLMMETVGATLNILQKDGTLSNVSLQNFLKLDMKHKIIYSLTLPKLDASYVLKTYKIMPRAQNAHAYVNAGFLFKFKNDGSYEITEKPTIVFGGINPKFIHAVKTEEFLNGKILLDNDVFSNSLKILSNELELDYILPDATPEYRKGLAISLFYKYCLGLSPEKVNTRYVSGGTLLSRTLSSGKQIFETDKTVWPLNQPVNKIEALSQCTGEAKYANDLPAIPGELFGAFVVTTVGQGSVVQIDPSECLALAGVVKFFSAEDIPGKNNFMSENLIGTVEPEEVFCSGKVLHAGQVVGMVIAKTQHLANTAAEKVKVVYKDVKKPILTIREAIKENEESRFIHVRGNTAYDNRDVRDVTHVIKGSFDIGSQYHFTMENQTCVCIPNEDCLDIYPATQWMDLTQRAVSEVLNIPENKINIIVRRLGGAYGSKISRANHVATACALATHILNKPVRVVLKLETNMESMGKRFAAASDYEVGVNDDGKIQYLKIDCYSNYGSSQNEGVVVNIEHHLKSCYDSSSWSVMEKGVKTDLASNTYCRAPGSTEATAMIENIMEHIAQVVNKDPVNVRLQNLSEAAIPAIPQLIKDIKTSGEYDSRKKIVDEFNQNNRWKKRGISLVPVGYPLMYFGNFYAIVSIYAMDGTVAVSHGGIECGQGINTKVAQVCAHSFGIPLDSVSVKPSNNLTSPNGMVTGGSITSECCCYASLKCCQELLKRLEPIRKTLKDYTWQKLIATAYQQNVDLCATYMFTTNDDVKSYNIWGVAITEVEVDVLTGQHEILRTDIIEDAGKSLSPEVDIGQVEGAFVMGLGLWLTEDLIYDPDSGELLTNRTWNYKPPGVKDIPMDFRVELRKNAPNPLGVLRSKATGEPPLCLSVGAFFALKHALINARVDSGGTEEWFSMDGPTTVEKSFLNGMTTWEQFSF